MRPDVFKTIVELLEMCRIETAGNFDKAHQLVETRSYDMVILDIMGVKGLDLLDTAVENEFPCVMLTQPSVLTISSRPWSGARRPIFPKKTWPI